MTGNHRKQRPLEPERWRLFICRALCSLSRRPSWTIGRIRIYPSFANTQSPSAQPPSLAPDILDVLQLSSNNCFVFCYFVCILVVYYGMYLRAPGDCFSECRTPLCSCSWTASRAAPGPRSCASRQTFVCRAQQAEDWGRAMSCGCEAATLAQTLCTREQTPGA